MIQSQNTVFNPYAFPAPLARREPKVLPALQASFLLFVVSMPLEGASSLYTNQYLSLAKSAGILLFLMTLTQISLSFRRIPKVIWWFGLYYVVFCISAFTGIPDDLQPAMIRASQLIQLFLLFVIITIAFIGIIGELLV